jgi:hypothetical protein
MNWLQGNLDQVGRFQSTKIVRAFKIVSGETGLSDGSGCLVGLNGLEIQVTAEWMRKHSPLVGGYVVFYEDGYVSYSPARAFEDSYVTLDDALPVKIYRTGMTAGGHAVAYEMAAARIYGIEQIFNHKWQQCATKYLVMSQNQRGDFSRYARVVDTRLDNDWQSVFHPDRTLLYGQVGQMWVERVIDGKKIAHTCSQTEFYDAGVSPPAWFDVLGKRVS